MMTKLLLSITIWLRKFQGKGDNFYVICNSASLVGILQIFLLFSLKQIFFSDNQTFINSKMIEVFAIVLSILFWIGMTYYLIFRLRRRKIFLDYLFYKRTLFVLAFLSLIVLTFILLQHFVS